MRRSLKFVSAAAAAAVAVALGFPAATAVAGSGDQPPTEQDRARTNDVAVTQDAEMLYVAITPCRIVNTGKGGGNISAGSTRSFYVTGTANFAGQGGKDGGCGIPTAARSVSAVLAVIKPSKPGVVRAWPAGQSVPVADVLSYGTQRTGTGATLSITPGTAKSLTVKSYRGKVGLVIDVFGYYVPQLQAYVASGGTIIDQSGRLVSATRTQTGNYTLVWDRSVDKCSGQVSSDITGHIGSVYTTGSNSYIYMVNNAGVAEDYWFNVLITC